MKKRYLAPLLVLTVAVVFAPAVGFDFVGWDDTYHILENLRFMPPVTWGAIAGFWTTPYFGLYVPVLYSVWGIVVKCALALGSGMILAAPFHVLNIVCHCANGLLVFNLLSMFVVSPLAAFVGALVFALHPLQVEAVVWVSGGKELLGGFFSLLAMNLWLMAVAVHGRRSWVMRSLALLCFVLAPLSWPGAVVAPLLCMVLVPAQKGACAVRRYVLYGIGGTLLLAGGVAFLTSAQQPASLLFESTPLWARPLIAGDALAFWLRKLLVPWPLCPDYGRTPHVVLMQPAIWLTWILPALLVAAALRWRRRFAVLGASLFVFLLGCAGNWGLVSFGFQNISTVADRYLYVSLSGAALAVAFAFDRVPRRITVVAAAIFFLALGGGSYLQSRPWRSAQELFSYVLRHNPASFTAAHGLAYALHRSGDIDGALLLYDQALALNPRFADAHTNMATALYQKGRTVEAIDHFEKALAITPDDGVTLNNLGLALQSQGRLDEALTCYQSAINLTHNPMAAHNLGTLLESRHDPKGAIAAYQLAAAIAPAMAGSWQRLGVLWGQLGEPARAEEALRRVVALAPQSAAAWSALGAALSLQKRRDEAKSCFVKALSLDPFDKTALEAFSGGQTPKDP